MENSDKALDTGSKRVYDVAPSEMFGEFMKTGWAPTPLEGITQDEVNSLLRFAQSRSFSCICWVKSYFAKR